MEKPFSFKRMTFEANSVIFEEGEQGDAAYTITDGLVEIRVGMHGDNPQTLAERKKGDVIGEMALFDNRPHMATAIALKRTNVIAISRQEFRERLDELDPVLAGIVRLMVKRLRQSADELMTRKSEVNWANWRRKK